MQPPPSQPSPDAFIPRRPPDLSEIQRLARVIYFDWEIPEDRFYPSPEAIAMLGLDAGWVGVSIERFFARIHPEDLAHSRAAVEQALHSGEAYEVEFRVRHMDGHYVTLLLRGQAEQDATGAPVRLSGAAIDLTARREAEAKLRQREADLAEAERIAHLGNWTLDLRTLRGHWSDNLAEIYGLPHSTQPEPFDEFLEMIHPDDREVAVKAIEAAVESRGAFTFDYRIVRRDGRMRHLHTRGRVLLDDQGLPVTVFAVTQDVTERLQLQDTLHQQQYHLKEAQRLAGLGFWELDLEADRIFFSDELLAMLHLDASWQGAPLSRVLGLVHADDREPLSETIQAALSEGRGYETEFRVVGPDRQELTIWTRAEPRRLPGSQRTRYLGTALDVTARRRADEQVRRSEAMLAEAERMAHIGSWEIDPATRMLIGSDEFYRILDLPMGAPLDVEGFLQRVHPDDRAFVLGDPGTWKGRTPPLEFRLQGPAGAIKWVRTEWRNFPDGGGAIRRVVGTLQDITHERQVEHLKSEILSIVSHELRTPLSTICAPLDMLAQQLSDAPESGPLFEIITRSVRRMRRLVDDILDMERLVHGRLEMHLVPTAVPELIHQVIAELQPLAIQHGVRLESGPLEGVALCDPIRISQVLANLLDNAIAFSPSGAAVTVSATVEGSVVRVSVQDRGKGVPPELQDEIFEPFRQGEPSATRRKRGTGLGLAVARAILQQHGGQIGVESEPGQGSTFRFTLPVAKKEAGEA